MNGSMKFKKWSWAGLLVLLLVAGTVKSGETKGSLRPETAVPLWPGTPPGALGTDPVRDVPTLTPYWPKRATGAAVVICPGGAYQALSVHEGKDYARMFNGFGITAFVLKYRLGSHGYRHPAMMQDVLRAIRLVRFQAAKWGVDPNRIGIVGSSAGGHLASTALTHFDQGDQSASDPVERVSSRPDLGILCYPVITMGKYTHSLSRRNLLGDNPASETITLLSNELQVRPDSPPCFLWHTYGDKLVDVRNSTLFFHAYQEKGLPVELHIYQHGTHGWGIGIHNYDPEKSDPSRLLPWTNDLRNWLRRMKFIPWK